MSGVGETRQRPAGASFSGRAALRTLAGPARGVLGAALFALVLAAAGVVGLAWRLGQGPLDVTWLLRRMEPFAGPGRVAIGRATIAWNGFHAGAHSGLELRLEDVAAPGTPGGSVARAEVTLAPTPLLTAEIAPRTVSLLGVRLRAVRGRDGSVRLDLAGGDPGGESNMPDALGALRQPAGPGASGAGALSALRQVLVQNATVSLVDEASGRTLEGAITRLSLERQAGGGVTGAGDGTVTLGAATAALHLDGTLGDDGGTRLAVTLSPLSTEAIATVFPAAGLLTASVSGEASLSLSPALQPLAARLDLRTGAGTLTAPHSLPVPIDGVALRARASWSGAGWRPERVVLEEGRAVVSGPSGRASTVSLSAEAVRRDGTVETQTRLEVDRVAFADLPALWPIAWAGHTRPWLTDNLTAGELHDGQFTATLSAPEQDQAAVRVVAAGGSIEADDVTIHWLRPVPPIEHASARLVLDGPDELTITVKRGAQGRIAVQDGTIKFTGLSQKDQYMALVTTVSGGVPDLLRLLRQPRLELLSAHPVPITFSGGQATARLSVEMPMFEHLTFDQVGIAATGHMRDLRLGGLVAGKDLERGSVDFSVTQNGLKAGGTLSVAGVPGRAEVEMDFRAGPPNQVVQRAHMVGRVGPGMLTANGFDDAGVLSAGAAGLDVTYAEQRDGLSRVGIKADLTGAGLAVAGWRKPVGAAAHASATVLMQHGQLAGIPTLSATGPALSIVATGETAGGRPSVLRLQQVELGPTRASGEVRFPPSPGGPVRVQLSGPVLDIAGQFGRAADADASLNETPLIADLRFGRVLLGDDRELGDVAVHAEQLGGRLRALQASAGRPAPLRATIVPEGASRRLTVRAADAGLTLRALGLFDALGAGALAVDGVFDDRVAHSPLTGTAQLEGFDVHDEVVLGKVLQAATLYGVVDALRTRGVYFRQAHAPFTFVRNVLRLGPSRASSASLGITAQGWIDLDRKLMDLNGTVVPAYAVNAALGKIPLIGRAFTAEQGGGLFAVNYRVSGPSADPGVRVNPLSLLTPGYLRRLFE